MKIIDQFLQEVKKSYTIYLDLDGVLTDFEESVKDLGRGSFDELANKGQESWIWATISKIGYRFWRDIPWTKNGKEFWSEIKKYNPTILTAVPNNSVSSGARKGKEIWIDRNLGKNIKRLIVLRKEKQQYAEPNSILIDDMKKNCVEWKNKGGIAIQYISNEKTMKKLKELI